MEKTTLLQFNHNFPHNPFTTEKQRIATKSISQHHCIAETITSTPTKSKPLSFLPTLDLCINSKSLDLGKQIHTHVLKFPEEQVGVELEHRLIKMYSKCGDLGSAAMICYLGFQRNVLSWSSLIEEFDRGGEFEEIFRELQRGGMVGNDDLVDVLRICTHLNGLWVGKEIHCYMIKSGTDSDVSLVCALMDFYLNFHRLDEARQVFDEIPVRTVFFWNDVLMVNFRSGLWIETIELFRLFQFCYVKADGFTLSRAIQACSKCGAFEGGKQIHGYSIRSGLASNLSVSNSLISVYIKSGKLELAIRVFQSLRDRSLVSWNSMISGFAVNGFLDEAWDLFYKMRLSGIEPDMVTWNSLISGHSFHGYFDQVLQILDKMQRAGFKPNSSSLTSILRAIIKSGLLKFGKEIHCYVIRNALDSDIYIGTSLVDMYAKNSRLTDAQAVFNNMNNRNIFSWNSLISGYSLNGFFDEALECLNQMEKEGIKPDLITWNSLISGYSLWGHSKKALALIHQLGDSGVNPNVISWTALISGCSQTGNYEESLDFFIEMQKAEIKPNSATIASVLPACASLASLQQGAELHSFSIRQGFDDDIFVATALIDMYSKSGNLTYAHQVFTKIRNRNTVSWNAMIKGFAVHGLGKKAVSLFDEMCELGIRPDGITYTALLSACSYSGLIDDGWKYFESMKINHGVVPTREHYSCIVDLLGRGGYLDEALAFIEAMPVKPDASVWGALLGACKIHKDLELGEIAAKYLFKLEPYNSGNYLLMMNLYGMEDRWEEVETMRDAMDVVGVRKRLGWSWIRIDRMVHVFSVEGKPHRDIGEIVFELFQAVKEMKNLGYLPDTGYVTQQVSEEEKEKLLLSHTEKLAITYGLIRTDEGFGPIRVINNTRVCGDCHTAAKYMSQLYSQEIFLRDTVRFHHFSDGKCSCNDYW